MGLLSPVRGTSEGVHSFLRGLSWLRQHPLYLLLLFMPMALGLGALVMGWGWFWAQKDAVIAALLFDRPEAWWALALFYVAQALLYVGVLILGLMFYVLVLNVISSPLYDYVSLKIEKDLTGGPVPEVSLWASLLLVGEELKKVLFIVAISLLVLAVPGLNVIAPLVTAFFLGWEVYDYPLARRGWSFRERWAYVLRHGWSVLGLGLWMLVPFVQVLLLPLAVAGGTVLAVQHLAAESNGSMS